MIAPLRLSRVALVGLTLAAGCGNPATKPTTPPPTLPPLSVLDDIDAWTPPTPPAGCFEGFKMSSTLSRVSDHPIFLRGSDDIWHVGYTARYQENGHPYTGLRSADSTSLTAAQSVAWIGGPSTMVEDGSNHVAAFFIPPATAEGQTAVMAARFLDGAWQMDPSPIWSGKKPVWEVAPGYDDSGVAHVLILFEDELLLATNAGGSWRTTPVDAFLPFVKRDQQYPPIEGYGVDGAGHLHVSFSTSATGYAYATDASGQWQITPLKRNPWGKTARALDASNLLHIYGWDMTTQSVHDTHETAEGFVDEDLKIATPLMSVLRAKLESDGTLHLLVSESAQKRFDYVTKAGASVTSTTLPMFDQKPNINFALDKAGQAHFAYSYITLGHSGFTMSFVDPCSP